MYIAFKWLLFLAFNMWLWMCIFDLFIKGSKTDGESGQYEIIFKNVSVNAKDTLVAQINVDHSNYDKGQSMACLHILLFLAGALAVTTYHKKQEIITYTQTKIAKMNPSAFVKTLSHFKNAANQLGVVLTKHLPYLLEKIKSMSFNMINYIDCLKKTDSEKEFKINVLLNKLKEMREERKSLGQLLISAIHENKNIRMQYQLETMTKNRLMQHIEDAQMQIKQNRSRYVSFQQLYLLTHQENIFLKARLCKLKQEKDEADKNLMNLVHEVFRSKNKELKAFCSRFIVKTRDKLLNLDVNAEIHKFLDKTSTVTNNVKQSNHIPPKSWASGSIRITEMLNEDDCLVPLVTDVPRLKGLPGEYVWTVKDKNGLIEKLYEYDYGSDFDNGDTIRRIRQYSVYYDKDCLLDFSKMQRECNTKPSSFRSQSIHLNSPTSNQRFLTGSQAFQNFLQNNNSIVPIIRPDSPLLCG